MAAHVSVQGASRSGPQETFGGMLPELGGPRAFFFLDRRRRRGSNVGRGICLAEKETLPARKSLPPGAVRLAQWAQSER